MAIAIRGELELPTTWTAVAFSADALSLMQRPDFDWTSLQASVAEVLEEFHLRHLHDVAAYFCPVTPLENDVDAPPRLGLLFAWEGEPVEGEIDTLNREMKASSSRWIAEGVRAIPRRAFASLAIARGKKYQLWSPSRDDYMAFALTIEAGTLTLAAEFASEARIDTFVPGLLHAIAIVPLQEEPEASHLELMKVAYALHVSERIIEADGEIAEGEIALLRRVFPARRLNSLGLSDRGLFLEEHRSALVELPEVLPRAEKLALMGLFYRMCQADGFVDETEIAVLREVSEQLRLEWAEVETYLLNLW